MKNYSLKFVQNIAKAKLDKKILEKDISEIKDELTLLAIDKDKFPLGYELIEESWRIKIQKLKSTNACIMLNESLLKHINNDLEEYRSLTLGKLHELLNGEFKNRLKGKDALEYLIQINPERKLVDPELFSKKI